MAAAAQGVAVVLVVGGARVGVQVLGGLAGGGRHRASAWVVGGGSDRRRR